MNPSQVDTTASTLEVSGKSKKTAAKQWLVPTIGFIIVSSLVSLYIFPGQIQDLAYAAPGAIQAFFTEEVIFFMLAGFLAQMIDGALGMAYGVTSSSILLGLGVSPAMASASVHVSEVFTTGISGLSHLKLGNVNRKLFRSLVLPGIIGAVIGAYLLTNIDEKIIKPFVTVYLMFMGVIILRKAFKQQAEAREQKNIAGLALIGGFMDAVGGGGWGPIVASTLLSKGHNPRFTIGSVNLAEFFIATAGAATFVALIHLDNWHIIAGLVIGGSFAAPFAAYLCKKLSAKTLMIMVGVLIIVLSLRNLYLFIK